MTKISKTVTFAAGVVTLIAAGVMLALQAQADVPPYFTTRLKNISDSRQVIVVVGRSRTSSYSTVYTYQKGSDGTWRTINVLRWLDPLQKPRIVMAPLADIGLV